MLPEDGLFGCYHRPSCQPEWYPGSAALRAPIALTVGP